CKGADSDKVTSVEFGRLLAVRFSFEIAKLVTGRRHGSQIQQAQAGKLRDHLAAFHHAGERQPQGDQFLIASPNAAECQKADLHGRLPLSVRTTARIKAMTGTKKRRRKPARQPVRKQTRGMVIPPTMKEALAASASQRPGSG